MGWAVGVAGYQQQKQQIASTPIPRVVNAEAPASSSTNILSSTPCPIFNSLALITILNRRVQRRIQQVPVTCGFQVSQASALVWPGINLLNPTNNKEINETNVHLSILVETLDINQKQLQFHMRIKKM